VSDLKEQVARAILSGNLKDGPGETALLRLGALAATDRLASLLFRCKYANDAASLKPARLLLAKRLRDKWAGKWKTHPVMAKLRPAEIPSGAFDVFDLLALQVIREWLADKCPKCLGRGYLAISRESQRYTPRVCPRCQGSTHAQPSPGLRARALQISRQAYAKTWESRFNRVHDYIALVDSDAFRELYYQLERNAR
jgi:hypothetical protein